MKKISSVLLLLFISVQIILAQDDASPLDERAKLSITDFYARTEIGLSQKKQTFMVNPGLAISQSFGYKVNEHLQAGVGVSRERYFIGGEIHYLALFAEASAFLKAAGASPYGSLRVGRGFGLNQPSGSSSNKSGIHLNPEIGMRFPIWSFDLMVGIGVKFQNISYHFNENTDFPQFGRMYKIRRPELRLGVMF